MSSLEDALEVIDTLIGLLIFAVIVGSVGSVVSTMNQDQTEFQDTLDGIKFYMNYRYSTFSTYFTEQPTKKTTLTNCSKYLYLVKIVKKY